MSVTEPMNDNALQGYSRRNALLVKAFKMKCYFKGSNSVIFFISRRSTLEIIFSFKSNLFLWKEYDVKES